MWRLGYKTFQVRVHLFFGRKGGKVTWCRGLLLWLPCHTVCMLWWATTQTPRQHLILLLPCLPDCIYMRPCPKFKWISPQICKVHGNRGIQNKQSLYLFIHFSQNVWVKGLDKSQRGLGERSLCRSGILLKDRTMCPSLGNNTIQTRGNEMNEP